MKRILEILTAALAFVFGNKAAIEALKKQIADRDNIIRVLNETILDENADDEALLQAAKDAQAAQAAAETSLSEINASISAASLKAEELAAEITADPEVPITVDPETGTVTPV